MKSRPIILEYIWAFIREQRLFRKHRKVAFFWENIVKEYFEGNIEKYDLKPKIDLGTQKIVWQYWGQGIDKSNLPEVVQICFESIDKYKGDNLVIRLDDLSIAKYLDLPDFVYEKVRSGEYNKTFFSDLLRLALLNVYGGVWLDATILLTNNLSSEMFDQDYFMFQRDDSEINKAFWKKSFAFYWNWDNRFRVNVLNSIFFSKKKSEMSTVLLDILLFYWKTQHKVIDYFFFQILYDVLVKSYMKDKICILKSDVAPHILQTKFNGELEYISYEEALSLGSIHKMSYFKEDAMAKMKAFLKINHIL